MGFIDVSRAKAVEGLECGVCRFKLQTLNPKPATDSSGLESKLVPRAEGSEVTLRVQRTQ